MRYLVIFNRKGRQITSAQVHPSLESARREAFILGGLVRCGLSGEVVG